MPPRRRCPFCRRWFYPHPRLKQRQKTCGRTDCRHKQKRKSNQQWRTEHSDYFRDTYALQREKYGTRADYKRRYRAAASRLRAAQRGFRPKMAPAAEIGACKSHKF